MIMRFRVALVLIMIALTVIGCTDAETAKIRDNLSSKYSSLPAFPGSKEESRQHSVVAGRQTLKVTLNAEIDPGLQELYKATVAQSGWTFIRVNLETKMWVFEHGDWLLTEQYVGENRLVLTLFNPAKTP